MSENQSETLTHPLHLTRRRPADLLPWFVLALLIAGYIAFFGWLSIRRHDAFETNALDLGYMTQAIWNTAHGRPFIFTTFESADYGLDIPIGDFRRTDMLLGYHVEPLLLLVAPIMWLWEDPRSLLWLQTIVIGLGAWPAYLLAREKLGQPWVALAFPALYLLAPSLQAANLSDFHLVSMSPVFFLAAYLALERRRPVWFALWALLALMCKEDAALLVIMLGLWAAICHRPRWIGGVTAGVALSWFLLSTLVIMPGINGWHGSPFLVRYQQFGASPAEAIGNLVQWPNPYIEWLIRPEVLRYGALLLGMGGGIVLFGIRGWTLALPVIAVNAFSSYGWMHSGGGHYSATVVAFLTIGAIEGTAWLSRRWPDKGRSISAIAAIFALATGLFTHWWAGQTPISRNPYISAPTGHHRLAESYLSSIPEDADVIAQSALYPRLATRRRAILFPSTADADYIVLDVTSTTYPLAMSGYREAVGEALTRPEYGVIAADDGILILQRDAGMSAGIDWERFTTFALAEEEPAIRMPATFGGGLILEGYMRRPGFPEQLVTCWRATEPLPEAYQFTLYFTQDDGALAWAYDEGTPTEVWMPATAWPAGERIQIVFPPLEIDQFAAVWVGVVREGGDTWSPAGRLPITAAGGPTVDGGTLLQLFELP